MSTAAAIRQMLAAGLSIEQALIAVEAMEQHAKAPEPIVVEPVLTARQASNARYYAKTQRRLKSSETSEIKTVKTPSDAIKTPPAPSPDGPSSLPQTPTQHPLNPPSPAPVGGAEPAPPSRMDALFGRFWEAYPSRGDASNPKKPAREKFERAVKAGADAEAIIAGAARFAEIERRAGRLRTDKIAQAVTWLNQQRWNDYPDLSTTKPTPSSSGRVFVALDSPQWWAWRDHRQAKGQRQATATYCHERKVDGWWFDSEWPPGALDAKMAEPARAPPSEALF